jgi:hypothetical protein
VLFISCVYRVHDCLTIVVALNAFLKHIRTLSISYSVVYVMQLATIHRHLDEMDRKLNVMQLEMEDTVVMSEYDLVMGHLDTGATAAPLTEVSYV